METEMDNRLYVCPNTINCDDAGFCSHAKPHTPEEDENCSKVVCDRVNRPYCCMLVNDPVKKIITLEF